MRILKNSTVVAALGAALLAGGCKREAVTSYEIPKEDYNVKPLTMAGMGPAMGGGEERAQPPQLKWTVPPGWQEKPSQQMGVGAFHVEGENGKFADIRVIPLRAGPEIEQRSVNMWRGDLGLSELPVTEVRGQPIELAGAKGNFYDLKSEEPRFGGKYKARTTAAVLERDGTLWFVKMAGEESIVAAQQQTFQNFLKSFRFESPAAATQVASAGGSEAGASAASWPTPSAWRLQPPGPMVAAAYQASKDGATADITVTSLGGPAGGVLANVNRWRGQIGLTPIDEADLAREIKTVDLAGDAKATAVDITGTSPKSGKKTRLYALIVPRGGKTWFYKMMGDPDVVGAETSNFIQFAATAH